jgi:hypothetical protein
VAPCSALLAGLGLLTGAPVAAQSIGNTAQLSFGAFIAGSGGAVVVSPLGGRSRAGGVVLVGQGAVAGAAQFIINGAAFASYSITLPADNLVRLSNENSQSMAVQSFVSSPGATGTLPAGGAQVLSVGATLAVGGGQAAGAYTGSFSVTLNYQ